MGQRPTTVSYTDFTYRYTTTTDLTKREKQTTVFRYEYMNYERRVCVETCSYEFKISIMRIHLAGENMKEQRRSKWAKVSIGCFVGLRDAKLRNYKNASGGSVVLT